ncbi:hypothetical protein [Bradyrhizobium sp. AUGA SZCCT0283]|uniref:hypothetical protein n=1 Tax=Bradyrhizobium sp. AUGA SZCCT0283 TaxID=2807671 RepID=UPI001BA5C759|nr:hypothetical protein [Bradyrhizobium sp. AUGA SZCCT0283]MBR1279241.1 hypothetical protein [Bradyrhizobium sp. AUGA SZCCT0283]
MQQATCVVRTSNEIFAKRLFFSLKEPDPTITKKVNQEMSLGDLDQVSGGVSISDLKVEAAAKYDSATSAATTQLVTGIAAAT